MNIGELRNALKKIPVEHDHFPVGSGGYFGEFDMELDALQLYEKGYNTRWYRLVGMPASYPEPD